MGKRKKKLGKKYGNFEWRVERREEIIIKNGWKTYNGLNGTEERRKNEKNVETGRKQTQAGKNEPHIETSGITHNTLGRKTEKERMRQTGILKESRGERRVRQT